MIFWVGVALGWLLLGLMVGWAFGRASSVGGGDNTKCR